MEANRVATDQRNNLSSKLRLRIGSSRHAWMDAMGTWSSIDTRTLKPWIYSNRHFNSSWQVYTIHESSDRQLHHARTTSTTLSTKHQGSLRKGTQQTNRNTSRMTRPKHSYVSVLSTHPHTSRRLYHLDQPQAATRTADASTLSRWAADAGYPRINGATAGDMHQPMSQ